MQAKKHSAVKIHSARSCRLLFSPEFVRGASGTRDLLALDVVVRWPRVFILRCSRERASCFLERSCSMREWWSFILCSECLSECETCSQMSALSVLLRRLKLYKSLVITEFLILAFFGSKKSKSNNRTKCLGITASVCLAYLEYACNPK